MFWLDAPVPRFVRAFSRATRLASEAFEASETVLGIIATSAAKRGQFAHAADGFVSLGTAGFAAVSIAEWNAPMWPEDAEEDRQLGAWRAFDLSTDLVCRDVLHWCAIANEIAVTPKAPVLSYLADLDRGILAYVYDDRGMDLISLEQDRLLPLYQSRSDWLLDFDRPRMAAAFGGA